MLAGADDGCGQLHDGSDKFAVNLVEQREGVKVGGAGEPAWAVSLAEGAAISLAGGAQRGGALGDGRGQLAAGSIFGVEGVAAPGRSGFHRQAALDVGAAMIALFQAVPSSHGWSFCRHHHRRPMSLFARLRSAAL